MYKMNTVTSVYLNTMHLGNLKYLKWSLCYKFKKVHNLRLSKSVFQKITVFSPNSQYVMCNYSTSLTPSPNNLLSRVKRVLQSKNMEIKDGYTCFTTTCVFCNNKSNGDLFINKITGHFLCKKCKASGSWDSLEKVLDKGGPHLPSEEIVETPAKWTSICEKCKTLQSLSEDKVQNVMIKFRLKEDYQNSLIDLGPLINNSGTHLYVPVKHGEQIVGVKEMTPDGQETTVPNIGCKGLLILSSAKKRSSRKREAVVVHSVRDMLALASLKLPCDIISLPHGAACLPLEVLPMLEDYTKIVLWFDNEEGHWESARQFAKKLNEDRCYFVRPTNNHPAPYKADLEGRSLTSILQSATPIVHKSITHFTNLREDILSHLQNTERAAGVKWVRFPGLNNILKGHRRGEMTILTGPSGGGKTTLMSEYSLDLAMQGVTTLWGSFEIRNERLARTMLQQLCRFPLHLKLDQYNKWADIFQLLPIYFMTFHGQQPLKTVMEAVEHAAYVHDIHHVVIDNVQFMMGLSEGDNSLDRFYRQDSIIGAFRNFATTANCHVTLVIHPRKEKDAEMLSMNSVFGGAKATQEADNVLIIQQKTMQNLKIRKFLQIAKNRYSGDLGIMPLDFDKESLSFSKKYQKSNSIVEELVVRSAR
uniref:DNA 5'-3' helicase n=1 Tax=Homalodisca liturata TaxID=320908 RepID=A0A1B6IJ43_9HEMI